MSCCAAQQQRPTGFDEPAPGHQHAREPRQIAANVLVNVREARHHVAEQEQRHQATDQDQDHRIDRSAHQMLLHRIELGLISNETRQCLRQTAGPLTGAHGSHIQVRKRLGKTLQCVREGLALAQLLHQRAEHAAGARARLLLVQRLDRLNQADTRAQQSKQFLGEQHQL